MKAQFKSIIAATALTLAATPLYAADYVIDTKGAHADIEFKISHLGISWLKGRFNTFDGNFSYDAANPNASKVNVNIDVTSLDSNHAERDKHLRGGDFLDTDEFPKASFVSTSFKDNGDGSATMMGDLTLRGITKPVTIDVSKVGEGEDPWGGYRAGFSGTTSFKLKDFGINYNLGPASETVYLELNVEGIRK
ncbi:YceI family protein [Neptunomonas sp. XY-337]|uniref:YceI family protein n=1 Tax=Neptunomonas sp. XY-337 TaxID=2561897 RepID=UPI0010AAA1A9|nr:YceI family protein [Neptunomonas sp. XY-337]